MMISHCGNHPERVQAVSREISVLRAGSRFTISARTGTAEIVTQVFWRTQMRLSAITGLMSLKLARQRYLGSHYRSTHDSVGTITRPALGRVTVSVTR